MTIVHSDHGLVVSAGNLQEFKANMLSKGVLKTDVCLQYLEDNWPMDDVDLEKIRKLYELFAYQRCSF